MGPSQENKHKALYSSITSDVIFDHISSKLLQQEIINGEEYQKVKANITDSQQMSALLDILKEKNSQYFKNFVKILKADYKWIADELDNNSIDFLKVISKPSPFSIGVTNEMMQLVQKNHRVADKWTVLAHSLGLSRHVMDIRIRVNMYGEANSMCILYLLQEWVGAVSKKATLGHLLKVLREQDFNDIADVLEEKFT
ncbi:Protein of unknown function [Gryllus bimaculatus]|nr:Protein of unknown function [Gryllus bimaculatus]